MASNMSEPGSDCGVQSTERRETSQDDIIPIPCVNKEPLRELPKIYTNKRVQLLKMLCLTVIPILGLWGFSVYTLSETNNKKMANEKVGKNTVNEQVNSARREANVNTKNELQMSVELGKLIHHLQQERDMSVLYLSALGPETKTFLLNEYLLTDKAIYALIEWPSNLDSEKRLEFESKDKLQEHLSRHRQLLSKNRYDINAELDFYTYIIDVVIVWLYESITQGKYAVVWKTLVAYLKLTSGKQDIGIERALGTLFYVQGGFQSNKYFEMYNNRINRFRAFYTTAELYSTRVDRLYSAGVNEIGTNLTGIINNFRYEIQHDMSNTRAPDIQKARFWFDNMTLYLNTLLDIQRDLGYEIIAHLDVVIAESTRDLTISATFLVVVLIMCPLVIFATENMTSSIQRYALTLSNKEKELLDELKKADNLLYQMVPKSVAKRLRKKDQLDAEYFNSVTIMFSDIYEFAQMSTKCTPIEIMELLNTLYGTIDDLLDGYDAYKVETINDCYMVASGVPTSNGKEHVNEVADFAIALLQLVKSKKYILPVNETIRLRIGINTGHCAAGIVGSILPRYRLFGDTVNTASRMKSYGMPNRIQITSSTASALCKTGKFLTRKRGNISIKGKGDMKTFWLIGKVGDDDLLFDEREQDNAIPQESLDPALDIPGEILPYVNYDFRSSLPFRLDRSTAKANEKATARVLPTSSKSENETGNTKDIRTETRASQPNIPEAENKDEEEIELTPVQENTTAGQRGSRRS